MRPEYGLALLPAIVAVLFSLVYRGPYELLLTIGVILVCGQLARLLIARVSRDRELRQRNG